MYTLGCCVPGTFMWDGKLYHGSYETLKKENDYALACGFEYIETHLGDVMKLSDEEAARAGQELRIRAVNGFLPKNLYSNFSALKKYAEKAFARMEVLGIKTAVFGSGKHRKIKFKWTAAKKKNMLKEYLLFIADCAQKHGVTVVIEPLNKKETNVFNYVGEACDMVRELNHPALRALGDIYHMGLVGEDFSVFQKEEDLIKHIHISEANRKMPGVVADDFIPSFFAVLQNTSYNGTISCEAGMSDFGKDVATSGKYLRELLNK